MKNTDLGKQIKDLRTRKGFSQDELANRSGLNLRTIQRIEAGETEPRGDSLQRLSQSLDVTPDELTDWAVVEDNGYLSALNLFALSFIVFPLMGVVVPFILWLMKKEKVKNVKENGKLLLNFQITFCIVVFTLYFIFIVSKIFHLQLPSIPGDFMNIRSTEFLLLFVPLIFSGYNFFLILMNTYRGNKGKKLFYQPAIKFLS